MNLSNRMLLAVENGPWSTSEHTEAHELLSAVPDNSVIILDRGYINYAAFVQYLEEGLNRHLLVRMKANQKYELREVLPDGTLLVRFTPTREVLKMCPSIPKFFEARVIEYQHPDGQPGRLLTTLTDWEEYPATELILLYHERWELEIGYDELKTHFLERKEALRSQKPEGIYQELWGLYTVYNLIRREMLLVADEYELPANRISFRAALMWIRIFWLASWRGAPGKIPQHLGELESTFDALVLPLRRSDRRYPRHVKIKMSSYKRNRGKQRDPKTGIKATVDA
jgi:hypothetical protein